MLESQSKHHPTNASWNAVRWLGLATLLGSLAFAGCSTSDGDGDGDGSGDGDGDGDGDGGGTGSGGGSSTAQAGCNPILLCAGQCAGDAACIDNCKAGALQEGIDLFDALSTCGGAAGCQDIQCTYQACPGEFDACKSNIGVGGHVCFAEGFYDQCDENTNCATYSAVGAAWGATDADAAANALLDCTTYMTDLIALAHISGTAAVNESCVVYECGPNE